MADLVVIGCGNPNRRDDGFGIEVVRRLTKRPRESVRIFDAGTDGMAVMFAARGCRGLVVVDACTTGGAAGTLYEVPGDVVASPPRVSYSLHDFRWDSALYAGRRIYGAQFPNEVMVLLGEAGSLELGVGLTAEVEAVVDRAVAIVEARLDALAERLAS